MTRHKRHRLNLRSMYQWHRYIGAFIAIFVMLLSVTGIMLNHTTELKLDKRYIRSDGLLNYYGIHAPDTIVSYKTSYGWVSQWQEMLLVNNRVIGLNSEKLLGALVYRDMLIVALTGKVILFTPQFEIIETLGGVQGVPSGMWSIGRDDQHRLIVNSAHGRYIADEDLTQWRHSDVQSVSWSAPVKLPEDVYEQMLEQYRGRGLSIEKFIQDLHSGRIFGQFGVLFVDLTGILLLFLACSGLWLWSMRLLRDRQRQY